MTKLIEIVESEEDLEDDFETLPADDEDEMQVDDN